MNTTHISGEVSTFSDDYQYSDERVGEQTFQVRLKEVEKTLARHKSKLEHHKKAAAESEEMIAMATVRLRTMQEIANQRGFKVWEDSPCAACLGTGRILDGYCCWCHGTGKVFQRTSALSGDSSDTQSQASVSS